MATPGPAQRAISNIININFPTVGGLVFFRVNQHWEGSTAAPNNVAGVSFSELPWEPFDMFTAKNTEDPNDKTVDFDVKDPVTDAMLAHWNYWLPKEVVSNNATETTPGIVVWIIDEAEWYGVYKNHDTGQAAFGEHDAKEQEMFDGLNAVFGPLERDRFGARLADHLESVGGVAKFVETPGPPTAKFFEVAAAADPPWSYHSEPGAPYTTVKSDKTAVLIINLAKAFKDIPKDPDTGKKPASFKMRIDLPQKKFGGLLTWEVKASADTTKVSTPPNPAEDGRRTFPLADKVTPGTPGTPAKIEHLVPQWDPFPNATGSGSDPLPGSFVIVTITFGTPKVKPKVEIASSIIGGGGDVG